MPTLDHRLLRQFLTVAEAGSVRAAARLLHMSQPPLTAAVHQLEERLGVRLFERSVKGMTLTKAGDALAEEARSILGRLERAESRILAIGARPRPLRVGFVSAALNTVLPTLLRGLDANGLPAPGLQEMTTPEQVEALERGQIDVGLLHPPVPRLADFECVSLGRDPFWAALPADHPLASRKSLRFADIAGERFVLFPEPQGPALYDRIRSLVAESGRPFRIAAEAKRVQSQLAIVSGGVGVGLVTRSTAHTLSFNGVTAVPLQDTGDRLFLELALMAEAERARGLSGILDERRAQ